MSLGSHSLRTQTLSKTVEPSWNKCFEFNVNDISDRLQFTVYDEENDKKYQLLGSLKIPVLKICNHGKMWYSLQEPIQRKQIKDEFKLQLEFILIYSTRQAAVATIYHKTTQNDYRKSHKEQFDRKIFSRNLRRLRTLRQNSGLQELKSEVDSILNWDSKPRSTIALLLYVGFIYIFQPWMILCAILMLFLRNSKTKPGNTNSDENKCMYDEDDFEEDEFSSDEIDEPETLPNATEPKEKVTIRAKINRYQKVALTVQQLFGTVAHWGECFKNLVEFKVPFLSWIAVAFLIVSCSVFYFVPFRYIVMVAGINKIIKKLIRPNSEGSMKRFLNFLSKVPDDDELVEWNSVKVTKCRQVVLEASNKKESKLRFTNNVFTKRRKAKNPGVVPLDAQMDPEDVIKEQSESDTPSDEANCDNNEIDEEVVYETASSDADEVDHIKTYHSTGITEDNNQQLIGKARSRNKHCDSNELEPEIQMSNRPLNFVARSESRRAKDISALTKEISKKGMVLRDKIVARSLLATKGSKEEHSDDDPDHIDDTESTSDQVPRQRKRDILLAKFKEKTNMKE